MISLIGLAVWFALLMTCTVCLEVSTDTSSQKLERILSHVGLAAGFIAFWMTVIAVLADTHSILGFIFWLVVGLLGTRYFDRIFGRAAAIS